MFPTYSFFARIAMLLVGYVLVWSGYSKKLGWVMLVLGALMFVLMPSGGPPGVINAVFLIMGLALLFKPSPSAQ